MGDILKFWLPGHFILQAITCVRVCVHTRTCAHVCGALMLHCSAMGLTFQCVQAASCTQPIAAASWTIPTIHYGGCLRIQRLTLANGLGAQWFLQRHAMYVHPCIRLQQTH